MIALAVGEEREIPVASIAGTRAATNRQRLRGRVVDLQRCAIISIFVKQRAARKHRRFRVPLMLNAQCERAMLRGRLGISGSALLWRDDEVAIRPQCFTRKRSRPSSKMIAG